MMRTRMLSLAAATLLVGAAACGDSNGPGGPSRVALLADTLLFDYDPTDYGSEASELEHTLVSFGVQVDLIESVDSTAIAAGLVGHRVFIVPESFNAFDDSLKTGAQAVIREWVDSSGGVLIINQNFTNRAVLDSLFGYSLATASGVQNYNLNATGAAGTPFAGGPALIWENSAVTELTAASLPTGARIIYQAGTGEVAVASIPQGNGVVVLLGWDWYNAAPYGSADGGWLEVLRRAIRS